MIKFLAGKSIRCFCYCAVGVVVFCFVCDGVVVIDVVAVVVSLVAVSA